MKTLLRSRLLRGPLGGTLLLTGLLLASCKPDHSPQKPPDVDYYTCTMHPSVKKQSPTDKCPICGMDLVPVRNREAIESSEGGQLATFTVPVQRQQEIGVVFATVTPRPLEFSVRTVGLVAFDRLRNWNTVTRVEGYVEKLFVASQGELVEKGQPLASVYSPDLLTTQREFFDLLKSRDEAKASSTDGALESLSTLIESTKVRLRLWNLTDRQIAELERTRQPEVYITLYAPNRGLVQSVSVTQGQKVMPGDSLVEVTDLSTVWIWAEFYQEELPLLDKGSDVRVTTSAYPGIEFKGKIGVIDPFVNAAKRVVRARIDVENPDLKLRPNMFVDVELTRNMGRGLTVPFSAVLPTGRRNIVFVDKGSGRLEPRFVELGRKFGEFYEVRSGLTEGDQVVASGNFLIDAEAKVQGALRAW